MNLVLEPTSPGVVKNSDRNTEIRARLRADADIVLLTSYCARSIRRDFNIVSAKMYVFGLKRSFKAELKERLDDLEFEVAILETELTDVMHLDVSPLTPNTYQLSVVSRESAQMLLILAKSDYLLARLYVAKFLGLMTREERYLGMRSFARSYDAFKRFAMRIRSMTLDEMMDEVHVQT